MQNASAAKTIVVLIHGVGLPAKNLFGTKLVELIDHLDIGRCEIVRIDWHRWVPEPLKSWFSIDYDHLRGLMRGFIGASGRASSPCIFQRPLHLVAALAPIVLLAQLLVAVAHAGVSGAGDFGLLAAGCHARRRRSLRRIAPVRFPGR